MKTFSLPIVAIAALLFASAPAQAQFGSAGAQFLGFSGPGTVSGTGVVTLTRQPEIMRLEVDLLAKGSDLEEAISVLKDRKQAARAQLKVLNAEEDSIEIAPPRISTTKTEQQKQLENMIAQRLRQRGRQPAETEGSDPVTVAATLTAEWKLDAETPEDILVAVHKLQKKIREADLAGRKEATKLSPQEQELLAEAEGLGYSSMMSGQEHKPGEPLFTFASPIAQDVRNEALAEAFDKAKAQAERLAGAAGAKLGDLQSVSGSNTTGVGTDTYTSYGSYNSAAYQALQRAQTRQTERGETGEALAARPGPVKYTVTVQASFALETEDSE